MRHSVLCCLLLCCGFDWPGQAERLTADLAKAGPRERREIVRLLSAMGADEARPTILAACSDPDPQVRREAMRAVALLSEEAAIPILLKTLNDPDASLRAAAADALGMLGATEAEQALTRVLADSEGSVRRAAIRALAKVRSEASTGALISALDDADVDVRLEAVRALAPSTAVRARDALLGKTRDSTPQVRAAALDAITRMDDPRAQAVLIQALDDNSDAVVLAAIRGLHKVAPSEASTWLLPLTHAPRTRVAAAARAALAASQAHAADTAAEESWLAWLELSADKTSDPQLVIAGLERTLPRGERLAFDPLALALQTLPSALKPRALALLARTGEPKAAELFVKLLDDSDPEVRAACARLLSEVGASQHASRVVKLLDDTDRRVRSAAALALGTLAVPETQAQLLSRLSKRERDPHANHVQKALTGCLRRLRRSLSPSERQALQSHLRRQLTFDDMEGALAALKAFGELGDAAAVAQLTKVDERAPQGLRVAAVRALQRADHASALTALRNLTLSESLPVRATAIAALGFVGETTDIERITAAQEGPWPMGPVASFALASLVQRGQAPSDLLCALADAREPTTRANAIAALALKSSKICPLPPPPRTPQSGLSSESPAHTWRAILLSNGLRIIAYPDPKNEIDLPDLTVVAIESPWKMQYGRRSAGM